MIQNSKEDIKVHEFIDEMVESCRHAFHRGEPKISEECLVGVINADRPKLFTIGKLALLHFATGDNVINFQISKDNMKVISQKDFPFEQLKLLYMSLDWKESFNIILTSNSVTVDIL